MAINFIEFAQDVLADAAQQDAGFKARAGNLIARFNIVPNVPAVPPATANPYVIGGAFKLDKAMKPAALKPRDTKFAAPTSADYAGAVAEVTKFFDRWFGTPTADQALGSALGALENGTVEGLMADYIALNIEEAKEIRAQALLQYRRDEAALLDSAAQRNVARMPGATFHALALLKEKLHERIRDGLRQLGGEGLQREMSLVVGLVGEKLQLNQQARQAMAEWVGRLDSPLYGAKKERDDAALRGGLAREQEMLAISRQALELDQRGLSVARSWLASQRGVVLAGANAEAERAKLELDYLISDLQAVSMHLAGTYNKIRAGFHLGWSHSSSQAIRHEDPNA